MHPYTGDYTEQRKNGKLRATLEYFERAFSHRVH